MTILQRHISLQFLAATGLAAAVLTFVMLSGNLMRAFELVARGVPTTDLVAFLAYLIPVMLTYTIPLAVLCGAVIVFGRLSAGSEITAMRASGISLWQILSPCLFLTILAVIACLYLHLWLAPICHERADRLKHGTALTNPAAFISPNQPLRLPNCVLYVDEVRGQRLRHIQLYMLGEDGSVQEDIHARKGRLFEGPTEATLTLQLKNAVIARQASDSRASPTTDRIQTPELRLQLDLQRLVEPGRLFRHPPYLRLPDLFSAIDVLRKRGQEVTPLYVELHTRLSLALAPLAFLLIGAPFGVRTRRSETSVGMVLSVVLALGYYAFIVLGDNLKSTPAAHPDAIVWIPIIVYQLGGILGFHYIARR